MILLEKVDPKLEVNGQYLLGVIGSLNEDDVRPYREKHNLSVIEPDKWYSAHQIVAFYNDLLQAPNGMFNLVAIGMNIVKYIEYPPQVRTMSDALAIATQMHYGGWRNGHPGDLIVEQPDAHHVRFTFVNLPLPSDLVYGICYGMVKRFAPSSADIKVERVEDGDRIVYNLQW
ncbi:MAG: hypothetical protein SF029_21690 [bacterium]|nr:hypothetical protein [bacterium]